MGLSQIGAHIQREVDEDILAYVREMQQYAPVTLESIHSFETRTRRREIRPDQVRDRVAYLVSAGYLTRSEEWPGPVVSYAITADGMDVLDGNRPWRK
jgi:hypothetical protein